MKLKNYFKETIEEISALIVYLRVAILFVVAGIIAGKLQFWFSYAPAYGLVIFLIATAATILSLRVKKLDQNIAGLITVMFILYVTIINKMPIIDPIMLSIIIVGAILTNMLYNANAGSDVKRHTVS